MVDNQCSACGTKVYSYFDPFDESSNPIPGDLSICLYCGHIQVFGDDLILRELNDAEMKKTAGDKTILAIQKARGKAMKGKRS